MHSVLYYILLIISYHSPVYSYALYQNLYNSYSTNFCKHKCGFQLNICCIYTHKYNTGADCKGKVEAIHLQDEDRYDILHVMNSIRNATAGGDSPRTILRRMFASNMHVLSYSKQLEFSANCWARQCKLNHSRCRANEYGLLGETVCWSQSPIAAVFEVFKKLIHRCPKYFLASYPNLRQSVIDKLIFPTEGDDERNRETIQLLWADTQYVGCAAVLFPHVLEDTRIVLLVCHYSPTGNSIEKSVFSRGRPCSNCPFNVPCNSVYKNLCGDTRPLSSDMWIPPVSFANKLSCLKIWWFVLLCIIFRINY